MADYREILRLGNLNYSQRSIAQAVGCSRNAMEKFCERQVPRECSSAVFAVGNAPTALLELCALMEQGLRPALVIGVSVGFVNMVESKELLRTVCPRFDIPVRAWKNAAPSMGWIRFPRG